MKAKDLLNASMALLNLWKRGYDRILKVSRMSADCEWVANVEMNHVAEPISYRMFDWKLFS